MFIARCRCLGVDTEYTGATARRTSVPALAAAAALAGRVFVTRDQKLAMRRDCGALYLLASDDAADQLQELAHHFGIRCGAFVILGCFPRGLSCAFVCFSCDILVEVRPI